MHGSMNVKVNNEIADVRVRSGHCYLYLFSLTCVKLLRAAEGLARNQRWIRRNNIVECACANVSLQTQSH